jgi:hypothetical protein
MRVTADVANCNARFLQAMMHVLDQIASTFLIEGRQVKVDDLAIVIGIQAQF